MSVFVFSAFLVPAFGLRKDSAHAAAPEWLTAVGFTMLQARIQPSRVAGLGKILAQVGEGSWASPLARAPPG